MDWPPTNPIPTPTLSDAATLTTSALTSISESATGFYHNSSVLTSALSTIGDAQFFEESISPSTVRTQLSVTGDPGNASTTLNLLKGMKWLLANMSKGRNVSDFFPHVVKLVGAPNLEVRKMVYIYLARYANHDASCREMALLSINAFQRGLSEGEPLLRSLALRVLTALDVPDVLQLQILGVRTCIRDTSPYVRKCAVGAVGKLHPRCVVVGDEVQAEALVRIVVEILEEDGSTMVLTSAMIAFCEICPRRLELLHGCYRKVCHLLTDMDEWGQVVVMDALMRYCRMFFKRPKGQEKGSAERIDLERRVTRGTRKRMGGSAIDAPALNGANDANGGAASADDDVLLSMTTLNAQTTTNGTAPPAQTSRQKVKRRVVRKAFYSDEEDESSEEEVPPHYPITGGNLAGTLREQPVLGGMGSTTKSFGFRDDVNANKSSEGANVGMNGTFFDGDEDDDLSEDHKLLLSSSLPLLKSRNSAVVLAVCSLHYYCGIASVKIRAALGKALVRIHRDRREIQYIVLVSIRTLVLQCPSAFTPFLNDFFIKGTDPSFTRMIKLDILVSLCLDPTAIDSVLSELRTYVRHNDKAFVCASVRAIGKVAELARVVYDRRSSTAELDAAQARADSNLIALNCLSGLVTLSEFSKNELVVGECAETMQRILSQLWANDGGSVVPVVNDPTNVQERVLKRLLLILVRALSLESSNVEDMNAKQKQLASRTVRVPDSAVASILWIVGEWSTMPEAAAAPWALDNADKFRIRLEILRLLAKSFVEVDPQTKLQAVHLSSKILLMLKVDQSLSNEAKKEMALCEFILSMGRIDVLQDVRDRSRYESNVLQLSVGLTHDTAGLESVPDNATGSLSLEKAKTMLLQRKPMSSSLPLDGEVLGCSENDDLFRFGTLSSIVGYKSGGSGNPLPKWADVDSPSSLRDSSVLKRESEAARGNGVAESSQPSDLYSSSSDDESSSDDSSSSSDDSSDESDDESDSDDSSSDADRGATNILGAAGTNNQTTIVPVMKSYAPTPSLLNGDSEESSSSTDSDSDESSESESGDSVEERPPSGTKNIPAVGTILDMDSAPTRTMTSTPYSTQVSNASSSVAAGLEDLVMAPLVVDKNDVSITSNTNGDSSSWKEYVRPSLGGGLLVKMRYLRGSSRARECQIMGLDHENPSTVCLQVHIENMRTDAGTLRHVRIIHRQGVSSGLIAPSRVITPPEILALKKGKVSTVSIGITFASATDRDGLSVAKFDIKSDKGSTPIEIRPTLGELLDAAKTKSVSQVDFDKAIDEMHGIHQRTTSTFSLSPVDTAAYTSIPRVILQNFNFKQISSLPGKGRFIGTLPDSGHNVYAVVECDPMTGHGDITVCCNNAMASNSISNLLKQALSSGK